MWNLHLNGDGKGPLSCRSDEMHFKYDLPHDVGSISNNIWLKTLYVCAAVESFLEEDAIVMNSSG